MYEYRLIKLHKRQQQVVRDVLLQHALIFKRVIQTFFGIGDYSEDFRKFALIPATCGYYMWQFVVAWIVTVIKSNKMPGKGYRAMCF